MNAADMNRMTAAAAQAAAPQYPSAGGVPGEIPPPVFGDQLPNLSSPQDLEWNQAVQLPPGSPGVVPTDSPVSGQALTATDVAGSGPMSGASSYGIEGNRYIYTYDDDPEILAGGPLGTTNADATQQGPGTGTPGQVPLQTDDADLGGAGVSVQSGYGLTWMTGASGDGAAATGAAASGLSATPPSQILVGPDDLKIDPSLVTDAINSLSPVTPVVADTVPSPLTPSQAEIDNSMTGDTNNKSVGDLWSGRPATPPSVSPNPGPGPSTPATGAMPGETTPVAPAPQPIPVPVPQPAPEPVPVPQPSPNPEPVAPSPGSPPAPEASAPRMLTPSPWVSASLVNIGSANTDRWLTPHGAAEFYTGDYSQYLHPGRDSGNSLVDPTVSNWMKTDERYIAFQQLTQQGDTPQVRGQFIKSLGQAGVTLNHSQVSLQPVGVGDTPATLTAQILHQLGPAVQLGYKNSPEFQRELAQKVQGRKPGDMIDISPEFDAAQSLAQDRAEAVPGSYYGKLINDPLKPSDGVVTRFVRSAAADMSLNNILRNDTLAPPALQWLGGFRHGVDVANITLTAVDGVGLATKAVSVAPTAFRMTMDLGRGILTNGREAAQATAATIKQWILSGQRVGAFAARTVAADAKLPKAPTAPSNIVRNVDAPVGNANAVAQPSAYTAIRFGHNGAVYAKLPAPSNPNVMRWQRMNGTGLSNRDIYMGGTPSKDSGVGLQVQSRMRAAGSLIGNGENRVVLGSDGNWYPIAQTDMGHIDAAVDYWNNEGRFFGPRSPNVRSFMNNPDNYMLEPSSINRRNGASMGKTYLPPATDAEKIQFFDLDGLE